MHEQDILNPPLDKSTGGCICFSAELIFACMQFLLKLERANFFVVSFPETTCFGQWYRQRENLQ